MTIVLDTCALIWWSLDPAKLSKRAKATCDQMERQKTGLVPSIALWKIAIKVKNNKLVLGIHLNEYVAALKQSDVVKIVPIDVDLWLASVNLDWSHRDPVDRIVVALAQGLQSPVITKDREIRRYYPDVIS